MTGHAFSPAFAEELEQLFAWRRDVRHFQTTAVDAALVEHLLDVASLAPSVGNSQPWRFVRVVSPGRRAAILAHVDAEVAKAGEIYPEGERGAYAALKLHGLREAPEWIAVYSEEQTPTGRGLGRQTMPETLRYSTVMAIHTLWLAARARGLGLGWVSILDPAEIGRMLDVPDHWRFMALLCLGWPEADDDVPELERRGWQDRLPAADQRTER